MRIRTSFFETATSSTISLLLASIVIVATSIALGPQAHDGRALTSLPRIPQAVHVPRDATRGSASAAFDHRPFAFEERPVGKHGLPAFVARGLAHGLLIEPHEAVLFFPDPRTRLTRGEPEPKRVEEHPEPISLYLRYVDANPAAAIRGGRPLAARANYLIGSDPAQWRTDVVLYQEVRVEDLYPGIDLVYYGNQKRLEYDFVAAPGAQIDRILLELEGAGSLVIDREGSLVARLAGIEVKQRAPRVFQEVNGESVQVAGRFVLEGGNRFGFEVDAYDPTRPLTIDPVLHFSTYLGGAVASAPYPDEPLDEVRGVAVDDGGNVYVTGFTGSSDFPRTHVIPTPSGGYYSTWTPKAFVAKFDPDGDLVYVTHLGGIGIDYGEGIAVDTHGHVYVVGWTGSRDFPTENEYPISASVADGANAFLTKLDGSRILYSTLLGGTKYEWAYDVAVDGLGNAHLTGKTYSLDFPTTVDAYQPDPSTEYYAPGVPFEDQVNDAFVAKIDTTLSGEDSLVFSTYLGGDNRDKGTGIAVDHFGEVYVAGETRSTNFPTTATAYDSARPSSCGVAGFVTKLDAGGRSLLYSTYLSSGAETYPTGIAVDGSGHTYVTGRTWPVDFPLRNGLDVVSITGDDAFVTRLDTLADGDASLVYSTVLGGNGQDGGAAIATDGSGHVYLTGYTVTLDPSEAFPLRDSVPTLLGGREAFVAWLDTNVTGDAGLIFSTVLSGSADEEGLAIAVDSRGAILVAGRTSSTDFPTRNAYQDTHADGGVSFDAFVAKYTDHPETAIQIPDSPYTFWYPSTIHLVFGSRPEDSRPLAIDATEKGTVALQVGLPVFESNVDVYLLFWDEKEPKRVFSIGKGGQVQESSGDPQPWMVDVNGDRQGLVLGELSIEGLWPGRFEFLLMVTGTQAETSKAAYRWRTGVDVDLEKK